MWCIDRIHIVKYLNPTRFLLGEFDWSVKSFNFNVVMTRSEMILWATHLASNSSRIFHAQLSHSSNTAAGIVQLNMEFNMESS